MYKNFPKVSVVVPMYNAEKYLKLCVRSILMQSFQDFEVILIDDGSTDKTLSVAESFEETRIKIIKNKENLGTPGATRNIGIEAAQGEYIYFCDDDDVMLPNALEIFVETADKHNADVVNNLKRYHSLESDFATMENAKVALISNPPSVPVSADLKTRIYQEFLQAHMHVAPWLFLYRRDFLLRNNIKFPNEVAEDVFFAFDIICATSNIVKIDVPLYIWRNRQESASNNSARITKNMQGVIALHEHLQNKLAVIGDWNFMLEVLSNSINNAMNSYILPFVSKNNGGGLKFYKKFSNHLYQDMGKMLYLYFHYCNYIFKGGKQC